MANDENIENYKWKKGQTGNPKGRPPNRVPEALKIVLGKKKVKNFYKLNETEINEWEGALLTMTADELKELASWKESNAYAKGLAISILFDMKNGNTKTLDKLRERQFGKALQRIDMTTNSQSINSEPITIEIIDSRDKVEHEDTDNENIR